MSPTLALACPLPDSSPESHLNPEAILGALPVATLVVDAATTIRYANTAAEHLFQLSSSALLGAPLSETTPKGAAVVSLVEQARAAGAPVSAHGVVLESPRTGALIVSVHAAPMAESKGWMAISLLEQTRAVKIGQQLDYRSTARSMNAMASLLAHEVKNPLSGIRGAAQLLGQGAGDDDRKLTQLICDEADRIVALVNRMEVFSDDRPLRREPVNVHAVLERVRRVAENGFASGVRFVERYDPSLPPVDGNHDLLVQAFLNLVKNAAEAVPSLGGEIILSTAYRPGVRMAAGDGAPRVHLPLVVTVADNGPGIPGDLRANLFNPFVTTKPKGSGLGLALVAKIVGDHGGIVEFDSEPSHTAFRLMLPVARDGAA